MNLQEATNYAQTRAVNNETAMVVYLAMSRDNQRHYNYCSLRAWDQQKKLTPGLFRIINKSGEITHDYA